LKTHTLVLQYLLIGHVRKFYLRVCLFRCFVCIGYWSYTETWVEVVTNQTVFPRGETVHWFIPKL